MGVPTKETHGKRNWPGEKRSPLMPTPLAPPGAVPQHRTSLLYTIAVCVSASRDLPPWLAPRLIGELPPDGGINPCPFARNGGRRPPMLRSAALVIVREAASAAAGTVAGAPIYRGVSRRELLPPQGGAAAERSCFARTQTLQIERLRQPAIAIAKMRMALLVPVAVTAATSSGLLKLLATSLRLPAMLTVAANGVTQISLGPMDTLLAVIA